MNSMQTWHPKLTVRNQQHRDSKQPRTKSKQHGTGATTSL
uniref:Uncharacterized protein n=1 Tax=Arundo donax TaxID=35708 RepID=A0A0A9G1N2_ARUDO